MNTKKLLQETYTESVSEETGEVMGQSSVKVFTLPKEPPYIKLYLDDLTRINELPNGSSPVLFELLKRLDYEGYISLNSTNKTMICERTNYKMQSLNNYLGTLVKKDIFRKEGRGVFKPNPNLFGRGDWKAIYKMREAWLKIEYSESGERTIKSSLGEDND